MAQSTRVGIGPRARGRRGSDHDIRRCGVGPRGFYGGTLVGTGVTGVVLTVIANGQTLLSKSLASSALAKTYFTNDAVDLGSLAASLYGAGVANLSISLAVTSTSVGSGFYGNVLIGDPPKASGSSATKAAPHAIQTTFDDWAHLLGATRPGSGLTGAALAGDSIAVNSLTPPILAQPGAHVMSWHRIGFEAFVRATLLAGNDCDGRACDGKPAHVAINRRQSPRVVRICLGEGLRIPAQSTGLTSKFAGKWMPREYSISWNVIAIR